MVRECVKEHANQVNIVASDVGHLEDGTYAAGHKLGRSVYALLPVFNEDWYLVRTRRFENFRQLRNGLLENLGWTDIDFSDDNHDWHFHGKCNAEMLPVPVSEWKQKGAG